MGVHPHRVIVESAGPEAHCWWRRGRRRTLRPEPCAVGRRRHCRYRRSLRRRARGRGMGLHPSRSDMDPPGAKADRWRRGRRSPLRRLGTCDCAVADGATALIGGPEDNGELGAAWVFVDSPTVTPAPASEVTATAAKLNGTVDPDGEEVTECKFEYGTTEAYGSSKACGALPGKERARRRFGRARRPDRQHHLPLQDRRGQRQWHRRRQGRHLHDPRHVRDRETNEPSKPAKATSGQLSVQGSGGTGTVTIGPYGSDIGGAR